MESIHSYLQTEAKLLALIQTDLVDGAVETLERARAERRRVLLFGNGGSAATASHFACDLGKGTVRPHLPRFKVIALNDNVPTLSAYANDVGYERIFAEPLITLAEPSDIAIGFSGSGNSPNVLRAMEEAQKLGLVTIGFTGFEGGGLKDRVQLHINVPSKQMEQIEDVHLALTHAICVMLKIRHE